MKIKSIIVSLLVSATILSVLSACSNHKSESASVESQAAHQGHANTEHASETATHEHSGPQFQVDQVFQQQLAGVFTSYVKLKNALVSSDAGKVQEEAEATTKAVAKTDMKLLAGAAHNDWMAYMAPIQKSLEEIAKSSNIEVQRKAFTLLTDNLYKSIKAFGLGGTEAFYEFCPMAFNNEGGYWLSDKEQIRNPYFGDKMLTCGQVKERLK